jgi:transmembrane sensor
MSPARKTVDTEEEIAARWLQAKAERILTDQEAEELALWLAQSERNARAFERLGRAWASPAVWKALATLADEERRAAPTSRFFHSAWAGLGVAAVAVLAAIVVLPRPKPDSVVPIAFETQTAEIRTIELEDGSRLHLNAETAISVSFSSQTRRIDLARGEFMVEVASEGRPFQVRAQGSTMTAVGTAFNVDRRNDQLAVVVTEGVVEITRESWAPVRVPAGKAARITPAGIAVTPSDSFSVSWREGVLATPGIPIEDLAHALSRYTDREIVVSPLIANEVVSGRFSLTQPDRTLRLLAAAYDFELSEETDRLVLSEPGR